MKKLFMLGLLSLSIGQSKAQVPAALQVKLQDTLDKMALKYHYKGLSAAVAYKETGIWKSAVGSSTAGVPLTPGMLIGIGSNTKTFTSALLLKLYEDGLLDVSDTIGTWVSGYKNIDGAITIRQILNHTSGIASFTNNDTFWTDFNASLTKMWTKDEILSKYVMKKSFSPGASWEYSNTNYLIAGMIAEKISGRPIQDLLRDSIINPLSLTHTFFPPYETITDTFAHYWSDITGDGIMDDACNWNTTGSVIPVEVNSSADAAGALVSTAEDNVLFWKALMQGNIIRKTTVDNQLLKWTGFGSSSTDEYGLGIMRMRYSGNIVFGHGGTWIGQINENISDTNNNIYITVLSNQDSLANDRVSQVVAALYKVVLNYHSLGIAAVAESPATLSIYPNPAADHIMIVMPENQKIRTLEIFDMAGRRLQTQTLSVPSTQYELPLQLPGGLYTLRALTDEQVFTSTLRIQ